MAAQAEAFCSDGVRGGRMLCEDCGQGFMAMEQQSKFYVLWAGIILMTLLIVVDFTTVMLLALGLVIGGAAQAILARRFPGLYAVDDEQGKSWLPTDETQAVNPAAAAPGQGGGGVGGDVAAQLRAIDTMGASGVLTPEQVQLGRQQVLTSSGFAHDAAAGGARVERDPAPLPSSGVDTTDVGIEPTTMAMPVGGGGGRGAASSGATSGAGHQDWHKQGMA